MSTLKPTPQQEAIFDFLFIDTGHLAVDAVAGAGKTTTLVQAAGMCGRNVGFTAFNTHIATELQQRLGDTAQASTLHGLGYGILRRQWPAMELDKKKVRRHWERIAPHHFEDGRGKWAGRKFAADKFRCIPEVVSIIKQQMLLPGQDRGKELAAACYRQDVDLPRSLADRAEVYKVAGLVAYESIDDTTCCDFDDMIAMPVFRNLVKQEFATLFVDEAQDLNPCQQTLAMRAGGRVVIVGDPHQAIMGFAGADSHSFSNMHERLQSEKLPLSWCFRCPTSHVGLAAELVPHIEPTPWAVPGHFNNRKPGQMVACADPGDMIICRHNSPIVSMAYALLKEGKSIMVRGRSIGEGLTDLVKKLRKVCGMQPSNSITHLLGSLESWEGEQIERLEAEDAGDQARESVRDRAACVRALAENSDDVDGILTQIESLFSDDAANGRIVLSSIHRAKGLEADRVWIYEPGIMPGFEPDQQELNLLYVALTRAKRDLFFVDGRVRRKRDFQDPAAFVRYVAGGGNRFDLTEKPAKSSAESLLGVA
jgi:superfamily I DNA/RNA helicase